MTDASFAELLSPVDGLVARTSETTLAYQLIYNGTNFDLRREIAGDGQAAAGIAAAGLMAYNGTTYDRLRVATATDNLALGNGLNVNALGYVYDGTNTDITRSIAALDAAPNTDIGIPAAGIGPGWDRKQNPTNLGSVVGNTIVVTVDGADCVVFAIGTTTSGTIIFETTADDTVFNTAGSVVKLGTSDLWINGAVTPTSGDVYMVRTTGFRKVQIRTVTTLGATVAVKWTGSVGTPIVKTLDMAPQPHAIGQSVLNYQSASLGVVASQIAIAATAGKRVYITHIRVSVGGTTAGTLAIYSGTAGFTEGTSQTAFFAEFAPSTTSKPGAILPFAIPWASATVNEDIRITTTGLTATHIAIQYYVV